MKKMTILRTEDFSVNGSCESVSHKKASIWCQTKSYIYLYGVVNALLELKKKRAI